MVIVDQETSIDRWVAQNSNMSRNSDSVSMNSLESSVVDSEFMAQEIRRHQREAYLVTQPESSSNQINLQISVITNGGNAVSDLGYPARSADAILREDSKSQSYHGTTKCDRNIFTKRKVIIIVSIVILALIGTILGVVFGLPKDPVSPALETTTKAPKEPTIPTQPTTSPATTSPTTTTESTTSRSTTTEVPLRFKNFTRTEWNSRPMKGKKKLTTPIKRVILLDTQSDRCNDVESCKQFVYKRQLEDNQNGGTIALDDIRENFLISTDGTMFEGRGFSYEGQHSYDSSKTSFNNDAIGVSFIGNYTEQDIESPQKESLDYFIQRWIKDNLLVPDYKLYYSYQLTESRQTYNKLYETIKTMDHWKETPRIVTKREWNSAARGGISDIKRDTSHKLSIGHSGNSSCFELEDCSQILRDLQQIDNQVYGDIKNAFYFGGNDFIFQGKSFDSTNVGLSVLGVIFLGDYMVESPPQTLLKKLEDFIEYAIDMGKLDVDYELYGERQLERTSSPGDKFYEILQNPPLNSHFNFNITGPEPCTIGCSLFPKANPPNSSSAL